MATQADPEQFIKSVENQSFTLNYSEQITPAKGFSHGGRIAWLWGIQPAEEFSSRGVWRCAGPTPPET